MASGCQGQAHSAHTLGPADRARESHTHKHLRQRRGPVCTSWFTGISSLQTRFTLFFSWSVKTLCNGEPRPCLSDLCKAIDVASRFLEAEAAIPTPCAMSRQTKWSAREPGKKRNKVNNVVSSFFLTWGSITGTGAGQEGGEAVTSLRSPADRLAPQGVASEGDSPVPLSHLQAQWGVGAAVRSVSAGKGSSWAGSRPQV